MTYYARQGLLEQSPRVKHDKQPALEIDMSGKEARIELPISGGELDVPLEGAVRVEHNMLRVPMVGMDFKQAHARSDPSRRTRVASPRAFKQAHTRSDRKDARLPSSLNSAARGADKSSHRAGGATERKRGEAEMKAKEAQEDAERRQEALQDALSGFPSATQMKQAREEYSTEMEEKHRRMEEEEEADAAEEGEVQEEKALEEAEESFPAAKALDDEEGGDGEPHPTAADAQHEKAAEGKRQERMEEEGGVGEKGEQGVQHLGKADTTAVVRLALRVPMEMGEVSAALRGKIEAAVATAAGVSASEVSASYGEYSAGGEEQGEKQGEGPGQGSGVLDKRKDLSVMRNESAIRAAAMHLQDNWIHEYEVESEWEGASERGRVCVYREGGRGGGREGEANQ